MNSTMDAIERRKASQSIPLIDRPLTPQERRDFLEAEVDAAICQLKNDGPLTRAQWEHLKDLVARERLNSTLERINS